MATHSDTERIERLTMPPWARKLPIWLTALGGLVAVIALFVNTKQFAYSYLLAFMFFLSICLGSMFLVLIHHLFDASWSVPVRRIAEHLMFLLPVMGLLFIPIAIIAPTIYTWLAEAMNHKIYADHALAAKQPIFNAPWVYVIAMLLQRTGPLSRVAGTRQFHDLGVLLLAFTVFYAYVTFSQYFLIWNAAMPEETFWYVKREKGTWWEICMLLIFGHFALPFLSLLRIDAKLWLPLMLPLCAWNWLMHFSDMSFNIMPVLHPDNFMVHWADIGCMAFFGGVLSMMFLKYYFSHPPYPLKDPRLAESLGLHHHAGETSIAPPQEKARPA